MRAKIDVQSRIHALGHNKGQWLYLFMSHHGIGVYSTGQVVELIACYMLFDNCDLDVASSKFVVSVSPASTNISLEFHTLMAKLEA